MWYNFVSIPYRKNAVGSFFSKYTTAVHAWDSVSIPYRKNAVGSLLTTMTPNSMRTFRFNPLSQKCSRVIAYIVGNIKNISYF